MRPGLDPLAELQLALGGAMEVKSIRFDDEIKDVEREVNSLERWLGTQATVVPSRDRAMEAVMDFANRRDILDSRQANLVSYGCIEPFDGFPHGLIGDRDLFPLLLRQADDFKRSPRHFRDCYQGLLNTYLYYDEDLAPVAGRENWGHLRGYLGERSEWIVGHGYRPQWVDAVQRNPALFSDDPGKFYGERIFRGEAEAFDDLQRVLGITDSSWLVWRIVVGRVEAALAGVDEAVRVAIPSLVKLLRDNPRARDYGLPLLLGRYRKFANPVLNADIRDLAVETLGNPWLEMNGLRWSRVDVGARKMVADWLKLSLIEKFFNLLAQDGTNDTRRLNFWREYHQSIDAMYFALGENARERRESDFVAIRKQMEGLQLTLTSQSNRDNNAFIMCMGDHVVVEFGEPNNACYIFRRAGLPFALEGEVAGDGTQLKNNCRVRSLRHRDGKLRWEDRFRAALSELLGVRPERQRTGAFWNADEPITHFAIGDFELFCDTFGFEWRDLRQAGGTLKVLTDCQGDAAAAQLAAWGFKRTEDGSHWWRPRDK